MPAPCPDSHAGRGPAVRSRAPGERVNALAVEIELDGAGWGGGDAAHARAHWPDELSTGATGAAGTSASGAGSSPARGCSAS